MTLHDAILKIDNLRQSNATPIEYDTLIEHLCSEEDIQKVFSYGSIISIDPIVPFGLSSIADDRGIWKCIKLSTGSKEVLVYTAGTSEILYYSIILKEINSQ